ncbi:MAG: AAA family ATPase [Acidimicrobiales bacterium]
MNIATASHQATPAERPDPADVFAALVDPEAGLCANRARFGHAHVVERVAALSAGRLTVAEIEDLAAEFLRTELVVRLVPSVAPGQRKPPEWSTLEHRQLEDRALRSLAVLQHTSDPGLHPDHVDAAMARGSGVLGDDQRAAVRLLCGPGAGSRVVLAPAGHGKTALTATAAETMTAVGRPVVALATTNTAVAELRAAGLDASTIARFRLDSAPLPDGSVVIIDEVSQVSTRDAHAVLSAVSKTPGAVLWCLGDDDQGRSVQPGGLATELRRLADHDQVAAAGLTVNRRQRDPAERDALAAYRTGDIAESQIIRTAQGWEHDQRTPAATRDAIATAAVADADSLGAYQVAVLAVSHAACEDLADRIRAIRAARGELGGPVLDGPGWGPTSRRYAAGDRVLFHTSLAVEGRRFANGTTGTIAAITPHGAVTAIDDGTALVIPTGFMRGERIDGTPNLSHGWARTIDGAQGGTWEKVHLLANPNLDRLSAYVGQSRGRRPTHTWNTTPEPGGEEHGNVVRDPRDPAERVLAAIARTPERHFAAADDPFVLDRQLRAERAVHEAALASASPNRSTLHTRLTGIIERREQEARRLWDELSRLDRQITKIAGLRQLRPHTRRTHRDLHTARDATDEQLRTVQEKLREDRTLTNRLGSEADQHARCARANQWRHVELDSIDQQLADHWTDTVLTAIHQDDPLAYGLDRLRDARTVLAARTGDQAERDLVAVTEALGRERVIRLRAVADSAPAPEHLTSRLGPMPEAPAARDTWLGLALHIERRLDAGLAVERHEGISIAERLDRLGKYDPLDHPRAIIDATERQPTPVDLATSADPERWLDAVERATAAHHAVERQQARELDRGLGISL